MTPLIYRSVVIVDSAVDDYQSLTRDICDAEVLVLHPGQDGVEQITQALADTVNGLQPGFVNRLHIISHGTPGSLQLGSSKLNLDTIDSYPFHLQRWCQSGAEILLYGCNVADGEAGIAFLQRLKQLTGAEIAASRRLTGSVQKGGDWQLEVTTGQMNAQPIVSVAAQSAYAGVLAPTVTSIARNGSERTSSNFVLYEVSFSEDVTGVDKNDFSIITSGGVTGASITAINQLSPSRYLFLIDTGSGSGTLGFNLVDDDSISGGGIPLGGSGTVNGDFTGQAYIIDKTAPTAGIIDVSPDPRSTAIDSAITIQFSEEVTGFDLGDLSLTTMGGANLITNAQTLITSDGITWTLGNLSDITRGDGSYQLSLNASNSGIVDRGGLALTGNAVDTWLKDSTAPTVTLNQAAGQNDPANGTINFTVAFSEAVTGFDSADITLGGTAGATTAVVNDLGDGKNYSVAVSGMTQAGTVTASIAASQATDAAGNANAASTSTDASVTYTPIDTTPPTVTLNQAAGQNDPSGAATLNFDVLFSEDVTGFTSSDVTLGGTAGAATAVVTGSGRTYSIAVSGMTQAGTVTASIAAGKATDLAGNLNTASTTSDNSISYVLAPNVTAITRTDSNTNNLNSVGYTVSFDRAVTGVDKTDFATTGIADASVVSVTTTGDPSVYLVNVNTGSSSGTVGLNLVDDDSIVTSGTPLGGVGLDNGNFSAQPYTIDKTAPTADILDVTPDPRSNSVNSIAIQFSEVVQGFDLSDLSLTRDGSALPLTGANLSSNSAGTLWTLSNLATLSDRSGSYQLRLGAAGVTDSVGNPLSADAIDRWATSIPVPTYSFSAPTYSVSEGNSNSTPRIVTVTRSINTSVASAVDVVLAPGASNPATPNVDFKSGAITLSFQPGETTKAVPVQLLGDTVAETDETIALSFANFTASGVAGATQPTATLTIVNDDSSGDSSGGGSGGSGGSGSNGGGSNGGDPIPARPTKRIFGTSQADRLRGTRGNDVIQALRGKDIVWGLGGRDAIGGGGGRDRIMGGTGNDRLRGNGGKDDLRGNAGNDILRGDAGNDLLKGGTGNDRLSGDAGNDLLKADSGDDLLQGGAGNDILLGGAGTDRLVGGSGNDRLSGGIGADLLTGGTGRDRFEYDTLADRGDLITDFDAADDVIVLNKLLAETGSSSANFADAVKLVQSGTNTQVWVSVTQGGVAFEKVAELQNVSASGLSASNFVF